MSSPSKTRVVEVQRLYFNLLAEFFERATGMDLEEFGTVSGFSDSIKKHSLTIAPRGEVAYKWADEALRQFHAQSGVELFRESKSLGGMKLVLGGSSRFAPLVPFAAIGKYAWDKVAEIGERKELSRSLMGVLAVAQDEITGEG